jgi:PAS domain-containing protein
MLDVTKVNRGYCEALGVGRLDLIGINIMDYPLIPKEERNKVFSLLEFCMRHKTSVINSNYAFRKINGEKQRILMRWRNEPVFDEKHRVVGVHGYGKII